MSLPCVCGLSGMPMLLTDLSLDFLNSTFQEVVRKVTLPKQAQFLACCHSLSGFLLYPRILQVFQATFLCIKAGIRNLCPPCHIHLGLLLGRCP